MTNTINGADIHKVVVACDAGMGSSVMLASQLRRQLGKHSMAPCYSRRKIRKLTSTSQSISTKRVLTRT